MTIIGSRGSWYRRSAALAAVGLALLVGGCALDRGGATGAEDGERNPADDPAAEDTGAVQQGLAESTCGHSICDPGAAVSATCDSCVASICSVDSFCCTTAWDSICVGEVTSVCGRGPIAVTSSTVVSSIKLRVQTGGDDVRGGSQAYGSFQLNDGTSVPVPHASLYGGAGVPGNSVTTAVIGFPARPLGSFTGFALEWDGAPRNIFDSYDNWDANEIQFLLEPAGRCPRFLGAAVFPGRMTGSRTLFSAPVHFP